MIELKVPDIKARLKLEDEFKADGIELKREGRDLVCCCPFHTEKTPSCHVHPDTQRFKCFGCGVTGDVIEYIQLMKKCTQAEAIREAKRRAGIQEAPRPAPKSDKPTVYPNVEKLREAAQYFAKGASVAEWNEYTNPDTRVIELITIKLEKLGEKSFRQASPVDGGWVLKNLLDVNPIFNRTMIREHTAVVIVEGEKCARALRKLGICSTTSPGGANAGDKADWSPVAGKHVTFWRDNDASGQKYQDAVLAELEKLNPQPQISIVNVTELGLPDGGDVVDFLNRKNSSPLPVEVQVCEVIANADGVGTVAEWEKNIADAISGARVNVPFPWPNLSRSMRALIPGAVCILCGPPGDGKSLALLQIIAHCCELKFSVKLLCCEDGTAYHLQRRWAQVAGECGLTNDEWLKDHADQAREAQAQFRPQMIEFAKCLDAPNANNKLTVDDLVAWVKKQAEAGVRVIAIDPITVMSKGMNGFQDDLRFMMEAKKIVEQHKASLVLVTHPPKVTSKGKGGGMNLSDMAGGAAYERFSQSIMCFFAHELKKKERVGSGDPERGKDAEFDRTIKVMKARNSWGKNKYFGFLFEHKSLTVSEIAQVER